MMPRGARMAWLLVIFATPLASQAPQSAAAGYEYYAMGDLKSATPRKTEPALMLMGGGEWVQETFPLAG